MWGYQILVWLLVVLLSKMTTMGIMVIFEVPFSFIGQLLLLPFEPFPKLELVMIMIILPVIVNSLMFWVTDMFLSAKESSKEKLPLKGCKEELG